jgi:transcription antitermination factor NusG
VAWLVAQTESQRESVAVRWLTDQRFETYLPQIRVETVMRQRKVERLAPLFPSYLFVRAVECWQAIRRSVAVVDVLFTGELPAQLSDEIIGRIRAQEQDGIVQLRSRSEFRRGDKVRIVRGALQGQLAIYESMKPHQRCEVLFTWLGAERRLEIGRRDILRVNGQA